jgi:hypothetical protein
MTWTTLGETVTNLSTGGANPVLRTREVLQ